MPTFARGGRRHRHEFGVITAAERLASDRFFADLIGGPESAIGHGLLTEERDPLKSRLGFLYWDPSRGSAPGRPFGAPTGSAFIKTIAGKEAPTSWQRREDAIARELINGNFPDFLVQQWAAVPVKDGAGLEGRVWVMPDYLSVGNDQDWVYIPMSAPTAQRVADALTCVLPTAKLCHDIYQASTVQLPRIERDYWREGKQRAQRQSAPKDCSQVSTCAYEEHSDAIKKQMKGLNVTPGTFVAGHKKDVIIAANYPRNRVAFQGFYKDGIPAEPCNEKGHKAVDPTCKRPGTPTFAHERIFADYAQGVRLVRAKMRVEGEPDLMNVSDVLAHERYHKLLSPEGRIVPARVPDVTLYG